MYGAQFITISSMLDNIASTISSMVDNIVGLPLPWKSCEVKESGKQLD